MNPNVFALAEDMTVGEAITELQAARDVEMVFYLYVVDERRHLVGVMSLRRLLLVAPETPLKRIMTADVILRVRVDTDQEEVARQVASYNLLAIPVVDDENKLVGVITVDDVIDVIKDEATEDIYRLAGVSSDERVFTPAPDVAAEAAAVAGREPGDGVRSAAVGRKLLRGHDRAGHGPGRLHADRRRHGRQRGHADPDRHRPRHRARRARPGATRARRCCKEVLVGLGNGARPAGSWPPVARGWCRGTRGSALILALAMVMNMFVAATAGTLMPLGLRALKVDPALASSVFITTADRRVRVLLPSWAWRTLLLRRLGAGGVEYTRTGRMPLRHSATRSCCGRYRLGESRPDRGAS